MTDIDVAQLAVLAKLRLDPDAAEEAVGHVRRLLDRFAAIQGVDTAGVAPSPYPLEIPHRLRPDLVEPALPLAEVLQNAPATRAGCFAVPRVVDG
ncbi:MAG: Asp-tRNA(Asn)/Glu-tRNA(Gln) amidotransferase subunit GatC [Planctomycetes bacterium]|nr:Asp-tRNA(Asn)/Glu-tRNA(Gln) amidotransferase subunit GatC [Planctomycetota bacterium]MCB9869557.1 Asp-tRNA(Asn)/Glu-tRNA(Gln) amidotransferase subunit GatC [Planctomycetota bacterium]